MKVKQKKETKKKKEHLCISCLEDTKPTDLYWVFIVDEFEMSFQMPFCDKCLKNKNNFENFISYEVLHTVHKKREYKKKKELDKY